VIDTDYLSDAYFLTSFSQVYVSAATHPAEPYDAAGRPISDAGIVYSHTALHYMDLVYANSPQHRMKLFRRLLLKLREIVKVEM